MAQEWIEEEITVGDLKTLLGVITEDITEGNNGIDVSSQGVEIHTPDGWQPLTHWFNKGPLPMVKVESNNGLETVCATNHLIQVNSLVNDWIPASELSNEDEVITVNGSSLVKNVSILDEQTCYDFTVGHRNHRYWGDGFSSHNSGKSYLVSGNIARNAQKEGYFVVMIDSENALDEAWLHALGVSTDETKLLKLNVAMIDDVAKLINEFVKSYKSEWKDTPRDERPKVLFIIDSLGMLLTPTDVDQFEAGNMKGDMGRKPKALAALVRNCVNTFGEWDMGLVATQHSYASQDMFDPDDKITGGQGFIYASSIVLAMRKLKLKEDSEGNKISDVTGIRSQVKCMKTRYNKPFEQCELKIPYETGLDPYSGLIEFFESKGYLVKDGNRLRYTDLNGVEVKNFRKQIDHDLLDKIMTEFPLWEEKKEAEKKKSIEVDDIVDDTVNIPME